MLSGHTDHIRDGIRWELGSVQAEKVFSKKPTCTGRTKGNTIRRGTNTIVNQDNYICASVELNLDYCKSLAVTDSETVTPGEV